MKRFPQLQRYMRATVAASAVATLLLLIAVNGVHAELQDQMWRVGEALTPLASDPDATGAPRMLVVNGAPILMRTETRSENIEAVLDAAEKDCAGYDVGPWSTTIRDSDSRGGFVACFPKLRHIEASDARSLLSAFSKNGDLSGLGPMTYTYARKTRIGTHRLQAEIQSVNLQRLSPTEGDAPGVDVPGIPRPPEARRLFSALQVDRSYQLAMYSGTPGAPASLRDDYAQRLEDQGWSVESSSASSGHVALVALRGSQMITLTFRKHNGKTTTTIASGL